ncbi:MAG: caspase family protein, partial [Desulfobacterales bacterium]|nr:caspase family protein [Desulfobacterales bacterium]
MLKIGDSGISFPLYQANGITLLSTFSGNLFLGLRDGFVNRYGKPQKPEWYYDNKGLFSIDIIVWETNDWSKPEKFFERMKAKSPNNEAIVDAYAQANKIKDAIFFVSKQDSEGDSKAPALKLDEKKKPISSTQSDVVFLKTNYQKPDAVAVVIGNRNYLNKDIPTAEFAHNDAEAIKRYLIETLGYREGNILFETDVTKTQMDMIFGIESDHRGILDSYIKPGKSDVFVYYSGHGAPNMITNEAYFVPTDANPAMMALTGYSLNTFYRNLSMLESKNITVVIDSCFSGGTSIGKALVPGANPA